MNKRKIYLGIISVTNILWIIGLIRLEWTLIRMNQSLNSLSYFIGNQNIPFFMHLLIIFTIASLVTWLWINISEIKNLYNKELSKTKEKIHELTADKGKSKSNEKDTEE